MKTEKRKATGKSGIKRVRRPPAQNTPLQEEFLRFIEYHPSRRFNRNLRKMLLEFMMSDVAVEAFYIKDLLYDLEGLFDLLDAIEAEEEMKIEK